MIFPLPTHGALCAEYEASLAHARLRHALRCLGIVPEEWPQVCWPSIAQIVAVGILRPADLLTWCHTAADIAPAEPLTDTQLLEVVARLAAVSPYVARLTSSPLRDRKALHYGNATSTL